MAEKRLVHVIDDDAPVRRSLDFLLAHAGYSVTCWDSGEAFLARADRSRRACAILDVRMPGLDGLEVHKAMAGMGLDFPVIVLTGHGDIGQAVRAMQEGAIDFLEKPVDRERLLGALENAFAALEDREYRAKLASVAHAQIGKLTTRERETLDGLACGYPNKTIAYDLGISARTVEVYRANIMNKLGVISFAEALRIAFAAGLGSLSAWQEARKVADGKDKAPAASRRFDDVKALANSAGVNDEQRKHTDEDR